MSGLPIVGGGLALLLLAGAAGAGEGSFFGEIGLGVGYSSNALLLPEGGPSGAYAPYALEAGWNRPFGEGHRFRLRFTADGWRYYDADLRNGDERHMELEGGWRWRLQKTKTSQSWLSAKLEAGYDREMLIRRSTGEDFIYDEGPLTVNLRERYISRYYRVELGFVRRTRNGRLKLEMDVRRRDYQYDYREIPTVDSLDNDRLKVGGSYRRSLGPRVYLKAGGDLEWRSYEEKFPLDEDLEDVRGGPAQEYRYGTLVLEAGWRPLPGDRLRDRLLLSVARRLERRDDLYRGMLDREDHDWKFEADAQLPRGVELEVDLSRERRSYDSYPVNGRPGNPLFRQEVWELDVGVAIPIASRFRLEISGSREDSDSSHPLYRFNETRGQTLFVWSF